MKTQPTDQNRVTPWFVALALLAGACGSPVDGAEDLDMETEPATITESSEALVNLIPDDGPPGESCQFNVPTSCPQSYSLSYPLRPFDEANSPRRTQTFAREVEADLTWNGTHLLCVGEDEDFVTDSFVLASTTLPFGTVANEGANGVTFNPPIGGVNAQGDGGWSGIYCSATAQGGVAIKTGTLEAPGFGSRSVPLQGFYDHTEFNEQTREVSVFCRYRLDGNQLSHWRNRPNDMISTDGSRFVRGYDLSGSALQGACSALASSTCGGGPNSAGIHICLENETQGCVNDFSQFSDPCGACGTRQECTSSSECNGGNGRCEEGCCTYTPR